MDEEIVSPSREWAVARPEASRFRCTISCSSREPLVVGWTVAQSQTQKALQDKIPGGCRRVKNWLYAIGILMECNFFLDSAEI